MKGKIYKIVNTIDDKIYVGSTSMSHVNKRFTLHKSSYKKWLRGLSSYYTSFELFEDYGIENCKIELIEEIEISDRKELFKRENFWINELREVCVNKKPSYSSDEKKITDMKKANKKYYEKNRDKILQQKNTYRKLNYIENKDKVLKRSKEWAKGKKFCIYCGEESNKGHFSLHKKTVKHMKNVEYFENVFND